MAPPPILGDADEPLGTGVLGDVGGGSAHLISGNVAAVAAVRSLIKHAFRGGGEDRREQKRQKQLSWERVVAAKRARERKDRQQAEVERRERERAAWVAEAQRQAELAAKRAELEALALQLYAAKQARLARDEEDIAVLLLAA